MTRALTVLNALSFLLCMMTLIKTSLAVKADHHLLAAKYGSKAQLPISAQLQNGRYGQTALYFSDVKTLLLIGGELSTDAASSDLYITNNVISLDASASYPQTANKKADVAYAKSLLPNAWTATALDASENVWMIGGVTQDCKNDAIVQLYNSTKQTWSTIPSTRSTPPRRRQAQAVAINAQDALSSQIYVWGGIADEYTCSAEQVGYLAMDIWNTLTQVPQTLSWQNLAKSIPSSYQPPVSDYTTLVLPDNSCIIYLGGKDIKGNVVDMRTLLIFDSSKMQFSLQKTTNSPLYPEARSGHASVWLSKTRLLVQGGLNAQTQPADGDWYLDVTSWKWSRLTIAKQSIAAPNLAYHTATLFGTSSIAIAYGLNAHTLRTSNQIYFLTTNAKHEWAWSTTYTSPSAVRHVKPTEAVPVTTAELVNTYELPSSVSVSVAPALSATQAPVAQDDSTPRSTIVASTVGGLFAFALLVGGVVFFLKRRSPSPFTMLNSPKSNASKEQFGPKPVSELLFTRPVPKRNLSLTSTTSQRFGHSPRDSDGQIMDEFGTFRVISARGGLLSPPHEASSVQSYPFLQAVQMAPTSSKESEGSGSDYSNNTTPRSVGQSTPNALLSYVSSFLASPKAPSIAEEKEKDPYTTMTPRLDRMTSTRSRRKSNPKEEPNLQVVNLDD